MRRPSSIESASMAIIELAWRVILVCIAVYLTLQGIKGAYSLGHGLMYDHAMEAAPGRELELEIKSSDSRESIGEKLLDKGLIDNSSAFLLQSRLYKTDFEPGSYTLNTSMKLSEILSRLHEEGKKLRELKEKNLLSAEESPAQEETGDVELIGGDEDIIGGDITDAYSSEPVEEFFGGDEDAIG